MVSPFGTGNQGAPLGFVALGSDCREGQTVPATPTHEGKALGFESVTQGHGVFFCSPPLAPVTGKEQHPLFL